MRIPCALLVVMLGWVGVAHAEMAEPPRVVEATSPNKKYKVVFKPATGVELFKKGTSVWSAKVVDHPRFAVVTDDGRVAAIDAWGGHGKAFVSWDPAGTVVVDRRLEEVITADELGKTSISRGSGRRWLATTPVLVKDRVELQLGDGTKLQLRIKDGVQYRGGKVFAVPTDMERFAAYVGGKRTFTSAQVRFIEQTSNGTEGRYCTADETTTKCSVYVAGKQTDLATKHTEKSFKAALVASAFLTGVPRGPAPQGNDRWHIWFDFVESGTTYTYMWSWVADPGGKQSQLLALFGI